MIHIPGQAKGGISHTFGGQVDALPTLLHLLGVDTKNYLQLGQDLLSKERTSMVTLRNGNVITPKYTILGDNTFNTKTGEEYTNPTPAIQKSIEKYKTLGEKQLYISDTITNGDLLRFYEKSGLKPIKPEDYNYKDGLAHLEAIERKKGDASTSLYSERKGQSSVDLYVTKTYQEYHGNPLGTSTSSSSSVEDK
jgi:lipoteichoic acid synthase